MSKCSNFLVHCPIHPTNCPDLLRLADEINIPDANYALHPLEICKSRCLTIQAYLLHNPDKTECFHFRYLTSSGTEERVGKILGPPEFEITAIKTPRNPRPNPRRQVGSNESAMKEEVPDGKRRATRQGKKARVSLAESPISRSRSKSKDNRRETARRWKGKRKTNVKFEASERKMDDWINDNFEMIDKRLDDLDLTIGDIKKTQVLHARRQYETEKNIRIIVENVGKLSEGNQLSEARMDRMENFQDGTSKNVNSLVNVFKGLISGAARNDKNEQNYQGNQSRSSSQPRANTSGFVAKNLFPQNIIKLASNGPINSLSQPNGTGFESSSQASSK